MDPSQMYTAADHGSWWWIACLSLMAFLVVVLSAALLWGISRAYSSSTPSPEAPPAEHPADQDDLADVA